MGHFASCLKEFNNPESLIHVGHLYNFMLPICGKFSEDEADILGWLNRQQRVPFENPCPECLELHLQGKSYDYEFYQQIRTNKKAEK